MSDEELSGKDVGKAILAFVVLIVIGARLAGCGKSGSDNVATDTPATQAARPLPKEDVEHATLHMDWSKEVETDPMTDKRKLTFKTNGFPEMIAFCENGEKRLNLYIRYRGLFGLNKELTGIQAVLGENKIPYWDMKIRVDENKPKNQRWYIDTENEFFAPNDEILFMKSISGHKKLVIQPRGMATSDVFEIGGSEEVYSQLKSFCKF